PERVTFNSPGPRHGESWWTMFMFSGLVPQLMSGTVEFCPQSLPSPIPHLVICLPRHDNPKSAPQNPADRPTPGHEGHLPLSGPAGDLHRAVSPGAAAGGRALSG